MYTPDNWVIIEINDGCSSYYKVLAGWSGGYLDGDSWRMNSGITKVTEEENHYLFHGFSGSVYKCNKGGEQLRMNNMHIWAHLKELHGDKVDMIDFKDTNLVVEME
jgi:hypothetical protein|tara:strand:- start:3931 stop:4248 length:318 start_codon:yes stop_codon:yes gene_type:complete